MSWVLVALQLPIVVLLVPATTAIPEINAMLPATSMEHLASLPPPPLNGTIRLFFNPASINELVRGCNQTVYFNGTYQAYDNVTHSEDNAALLHTAFFARVHSQNEKVAKIHIPQDMVIPDPKDPYNPGPFFAAELTFPITLNAVQNFTIQAMNIGYVTVFVTIVSANSLAMAKAHMSQNVGRSEYKVTVTPRQKAADFAFDCSAAAVAILISFGIGCVTDTENLKRQLKYPVSLVIGFCCQFLLLPVVGITAP